MYLGTNNGPREPRMGQDPFIDIQYIPALLIVYRYGNAHEIVLIYNGRTVSRLLKIMYYFTNSRLLDHIG